MTQNNAKREVLEDLKQKMERKIEKERERERRKEFKNIYTKNMKRGKTLKM